MAVHKTNSRQKSICDYVARKGEASIADLSTRLEVSAMTIRRDLDQLAEFGLLVRTHGGAAAISSVAVEPPFAMRMRTNDEAKKKIALLISKQVVDGQTILLDGGSTALAIAEELAGREVTVCTLSIKAAEVLARGDKTKVIVPGGMVRNGEMSLVGSEAEAFLGNYHFDTYLMTISAISHTGGLTEWNPEDAAMKRRALKSAKRVVLVCDASKFGSEAFSRVANLSEADALVTDGDLSDESRKLAQDAGIELHIAE
ncbi:MAG: regulatory protein DeoR [Rhodoferax sp.]|nr:regulatory protein DeoR [Rhodoferax sp.]